MKLTDDDRAAIAAAWIGVAFGQGNARSIQAAAESTYLAGMHTGIERAATHIEWLMLDLARLGEPPATDAECARQLRALLNETAGESPAPPQP